ncbi:MAG: RNase adapter RapZ, partial [Thermodesulfobacteriota bacterium]
MSLQELVVVTGMSGSGKGTVLKAFEDLGFFCIDNLPVPLIPKFVEGIHVSGGVVERAALVIDIRAGEKLRDLQKMLSSLREFEFQLFVLYLEARDEVLARALHQLHAGKSAEEVLGFLAHTLTNKLLHTPSVR